jgi:hypothetical protein
MWNNYTNNLRGAKVWRAANIASPRAEMTVDALTDCDGIQPNKIAEKEEMLRRESCPLNEYDQYCELPLGKTNSPVRHLASGRESTILAVCQKSPRPRHTFIWSHTSTLDVEQREHRGAGEVNNSDGPTPTSLDAGEWGRNPQSREG